MPTRDRVIRFPMVTDAASPHLHLRSSSRKRSSSAGNHTILTARDYIFTEYHLEQRGTSS
jgi:hypothetical protein